MAKNRLEREKGYGYRDCLLLRAVYDRRNNALAGEDFGALAHDCARGNGKTVLHSSWSMPEIGASGKMYYEIASCAFCKRAINAARASSTFASSPFQI